MATCITCRHFEEIAGMAGEGICHKGHGYKDKTAQGLPKPKPGDAYRMYFDLVCDEDYAEKVPGGK